jgi:hypothetical protein
MMNVRRAAITLSAALAAALLAGCTSSAPREEIQNFDALYKSYATAEDLVSEANLVVRGIAVESRVEEMFPEATATGNPETNPQAGLSEEELKEWRESQGMVVTISTVQVKEVLKGNVSAGSMVEVTQLGGTLDGVRHVEQDTTMLSRTSGEYLLFLGSNGIGKPHSLLNPEQAMYTVKADGSLVSTGHGDLPSGINNVRGVKAVVASAK